MIIIIIIIITTSVCPDIHHEDYSFCSGSVSTSYDFHLAVSSIPRAECCDIPSHPHTISSPTVDGESLLSSSSAASSDVYETVVPPDSLKDLICFTFHNLSSCSLRSVAAPFSESVKDIYLPWVALYLIERASIKPNLHNLYLDFLDHLMDSSLIGLHDIAGNL